MKEHTLDEKKWESRIKRMDWDDKTYDEWILKSKKRKSKWRSYLGKELRDNKMEWDE